MRSRPGLQDDSRSDTKMAEVHGVLRFSIDYLK